MLLLLMALMCCSDIPSAFARSRPGLRKEPQIPPDIPSRDARGNQHFGPPGFAKWARPVRPGPVRPGPFRPIFLKPRKFDGYSGPSTYQVERAYDYPPRFGYHPYSPYQDYAPRRGGFGFRGFDDNSPPGRFVFRPYGDDDPNDFEAGSIEGDDCGCLEYDLPICGVNGYTYMNACMADCAEVDVACNRACPC